MKFDYILVPAGVGGLVASAIRYYTSSGTIEGTKVVSVEPQVYNSIMKSIEYGKVSTVEGGKTIINGLKCGKPSLAAWHDIKFGLYAASCINDQEDLVAYDLLIKKNIMTGYTGACAFGLTQFENFISKGSKTLVINTEYSV